MCSAGTACRAAATPPRRSSRTPTRSVPGEVAKRVTHDIAIPTIGIGAGPDTDAQVLVWQDMAGLRTGKAPRFVKRYADLAGALSEATQRFAAEVRGSEFPAPEHTFLN